MSFSTYFTPLMGVFNDDPLCYLLEIDNCRILLDCGWDDSFDTSKLIKLEEEIKKGIDAVILSHPDLAHIGALPYAVGKLGLKAPIYATAPIVDFGKLLFHDIYTCKTSEQDFDVFALEDVDSAFEQFYDLRYDQPITLTNFDIELTPHCAGHLIGGSFWKIQKETDKLIYAVDYNHGKERHLNPSKITMIERPSLMITDAYNALRQNSKRKTRDIQLFKTIQEAVHNSGEVLLPVDTAGRVLELLLLLDQEWKQFNLQNTNIAFLCNTSYSTQDFAKRNLEWMNLQLDNSDNPFEFNHVTTCATLEELEELSRPRVVLATVPTLECGFSRNLFANWAENPNNVVIFTSIQRESCLASQLLEQKKKYGSNPIPLSLNQYRRVPLEGDELEEYLKNLEVKKQSDKEPEIEEEEEEDISMNDIEPEEIIPLLPTSYFDQSYDLIIDNMDKSTISMAHPMFPFQEENIEWDAYGERVDWEAVRQNTDDENQQMSEMDDEDEDDITLKEEEEIPTKPVMDTINLQVRCKLEFIDFEGRSDGQSMKNVLSAVSPSKVILIHGTREACNELSTHCKSTKGCINTEFCIPELGEKIDVTSGTVILKCKLSEYLTNSQRYSYFNGYNISYINARFTYRPRKDIKNNQNDDKLLLLNNNGEEEIDNNDDDDKMMIDKSSIKIEENGENNDEEKVNDITTKTSITNTTDDKNDILMEPFLQELQEKDIPGHDAVIMGSLRLVDFRNVLLNQGYAAELKQGVLTCNNITVQKSGGASQFLIDGPLCDEYYIIKDLLYQQFSVL